MPYVEDENGNHILDEDGNKMEYTVEYPKLYGSIHVNDNGHLDTEDRHLIIKDGVNSDHAVSVQQLVNNNENIIKTLISEKIRQSLVQLDDDVKGLLDSSIKQTIMPKVDSKISATTSEFAAKLEAQQSEKPQSDDPMDETMVEVDKRITTWLSNFKSELVKGVDEYLTNQVATRIGRKAGTIPKTNYT